MSDDEAPAQDPLTRVPWSTTLRPEAGRWAMQGEVHAICIGVSGLDVLIDVFGYGAAHSVLAQVARLTRSLLDDRDRFGRHSGNTFLILTRRPYAEVARLVNTVRDRVFTLAIDTAKGRVPEGRFGVAGMDPVKVAAEAERAVDALIINAELAMRAPQQAPGHVEAPQAENLYVSPGAKGPFRAVAPQPEVKPASRREAVTAEELVPDEPARVEYIPVEPAPEDAAPEELAPEETPFEPVLPAQEPEEVAPVRAPVAEPSQPAPPERPAVPPGFAATEAPAPAGEAAHKEPSKRVTLIRADVSAEGISAAVEVEVGYGDHQVVGKAVGRNAPERIAFLVAEAAARALTELMPQGHGVVLHDLHAMATGGHRALWAAVILVTPAGEEKLLGIAPTSGEDRAGPARAVLNAVNRRISLLLEEAA